jgi:hypothetical protein
MRHRKTVNSRSSSSHSQTVLKNLTMHVVSLQGETPVSNVKATSVTATRVVEVSSAVLSRFSQDTSVLSAPSQVNIFCNTFLKCTVHCKFGIVFLPTCCC